MKWLMLALLVLVISAQAQDLYLFNTADQQKSFDKLTQNLRCLVCQNQSLADSNAGLAKDLRNEVYSLIKQGRSEEEVKTYLTQRYGRFILFKPPINLSTYILWFGPFILLIFAFFILFVFINFKLPSPTSGRRWSKTG